PLAEYRSSKAQEHWRDSGALRALFSAVLVRHHASDDLHRARRAQPGRRAGADRRDGRLLPASAAQRLLVRDDHAEYVVRRATGRADLTGRAADRPIHWRVGAARGRFLRYELVGPARAAAD